MSTYNGSRLFTLLLLVVGHVWADQEFKSEQKFTTEIADVGIVFTAIEYPLPVATLLQLRRDGVGATVFIDSKQVETCLHYKFPILDAPRKNLREPNCVVTDGWLKVSDSLAASTIVKGNREGKLTSMLHSPYDLTMYMDSDMVPCRNMSDVLAESLHLMEGHDFAWVNRQKDSPTFNSHTETNANSGLLIYKNVSSVQSLFQGWLSRYREGMLEWNDKDCVSSRKKVVGGQWTRCPKKNEKGIKTVVLRDQPFLAISLVEALHQGLSGLTLSSYWNCKGGISSMFTDGAACCSMEACVIDHKCMSVNATQRYTIS